MLQTPQAPSPNESPAREPLPTPAQTAPQQPIPQTAPIAGAPTPYGYAPGYPAGYVPRYQMAPTPSQASYLTPTGGQRMGLAIASLALLIPLFAIASGLATNLMRYVPSGVAIAMGLIASALVCATVVVINLLFNWDMLNHKR